MLMRKSSKRIQFLIAFLVVSLATSLIMVSLRSEVIKVWLRWIEFLSNVPGLSGLLLLMLSPVIFLLVCLAVKRLSQYFGS
ncbi:MAG: hypothetical protein CMM15_06940 [Rhodospirillaceae bacterium]|nr:hypothetical protein [Rhodospirillaceae bacterium]